MNQTPNVFTFNVRTPSLENAVRPGRRTAFGWGIAAGRSYSVPT